MIFQLLRSILVLAGTITGVALSYSVIDNYPDIVKEAIPLENPNFVFIVLLGFLGYLLCSMVGRELNDWLEKKIEETNIYDLTWSSVGFVSGVLVANLLFIPFYIIMFKEAGKISSQDQYINSLVPLFNLTLPIVFNLLLAYIGVKITLRYKKYNKMANRVEGSASSKLVDTSAIVDGRFAELYRHGFIDGNILVPNFILDELMLLANSDNIDKSKRGFKGLETVESLKKSFPDTFIIINNDFKEVNEVEGKLFRLALDLNASIITQDYNTKKMAELENIKVLNLNELTNALKPIFVSNEDIEIKVVKRGKEERQGVGFMSDGTMVVVEDGGEMVGQVVKAKVSNILQTGAGRIVFCRIGEKKA